jgi:hypothetical protein
MGLLFCQVDISVLVSATSAIILRTRILPGWLAWLGVVAALLALFQFPILRTEACGVCSG